MSWDFETKGVLRPAQSVEKALQFFVGGCNTVSRVLLTSALVAVTSLWDESGSYLASGRGLVVVRAYQNIFLCWPLRPSPKPKAILKLASNQIWEQARLTELHIPMVSSDKISSLRCLG